MESVYKTIEIIGSSDKSWEEAAANAIEQAGKNLRELRVAEVVNQDLKLEANKIVSYRTKLKMSFKLEN